MNFDKLPKDIKRIIFDFNRAEAVERTKTVFSDIVLNELLDAFTKVTYDDDGEYEAEMNHHDYRVALMNILPEQIGAADYMDFCREQQREMWREYDPDGPDTEDSSDENQ
jgi:hypothetical protein